MIENTMRKKTNVFSRRLDPNPEYWEGLRGACIGALYSTITERDIGAPPNGLADILDLLQQSTNPQADAIIRVIRRLND